MTGIASTLPLLLLAYYAYGHLPTGSITPFTRGLLLEDDNNCGSLIQINPQEMVDTGRPSRYPLLTVNNAVDNKNTIPLLKALYPSLGRDIRARRRFIDAVVETKVMKRAINYLRDNGKISGNLTEFKLELERQWFTICERHNNPASSAFQHVFMGEVHRGKVGGLHNWIYYNDQQGNINYIGYYYRIIFANNKGSLLCIKYEWMGAKKKEGSMFVGTSPEIELAIFTTCFMMVKGRCHAEMGGMRFKVVTVPNKNDTNLICTAYPINETF